MKIAEIRQKKIEKLLAHLQWKRERKEARKRAKAEAEKERKRPWHEARARKKAERKLAAKMLECDPLFKALGLRTDAEQKAYLAIVEIFPAQIVTRLAQGGFINPTLVEPALPYLDRPVSIGRS